MTNMNKITVRDVNIRERLHDTCFKGVDFDPLFAEAGSKSFTMSSKQ